MRITPRSNVSCVMVDGCPAPAGGSRPATPPGDGRKDCRRGSDAAPASRRSHGRRPARGPIARATAHRARMLVPPTKPLGGILLEAALDDAFERRWHSPARAGERCRVSLENRRERVPAALPRSKARRPRVARISRSRTKDVRPVIDRQPGCLLRRHVADRPHHQSRRGIRGRRAIGVGGYAACQAEIEHFDGR